MSEPARFAGAAVGLLADRLVDEPGDRWHPVAVFGRAMTGLESRLYADSRGRGLLHAGAGVAGAAVVGVVLGAVATGAPGLVLITAVATATVVGGRSLSSAAEAVAGALAVGDVARARALLPTLCGREASGLDGPELARAVVESVAENTVDAVVAPALWAALGGPPGALAYRAVNTMDAMVGHRCARYRHYGWASARLDDLANFVPARLTAVLVAAVRPAAVAEIWRAVRHDAPGHPSPNAGVVEAAFAAALGLRLGGANRYGEAVEVRPPLGRGLPPSVLDIARAGRLSRDVTTALAAALALLSWAQSRRRR